MRAPRIFPSPPAGLKTREGAASTSPAATGIFGDAAQGDGYAPRIEELYNPNHRGLPSHSAPLLPGYPNMREQMAGFLLNTFGMRYGM